MFQAILFLIPCNYPMLFNIFHNDMLLEFILPFIPLLRIIFIIN